MPSFAVHCIRTINQTATIKVTANDKRAAVAMAENILTSLVSDVIWSFFGDVDAGPEIDYVELIHNGVDHAELPSESPQPVCARVNEEED